MASNNQQPFGKLKNKNQLSLPFPGALVGTPSAAHAEPVPDRAHVLPKSCPQRPCRAASHTSLSPPWGRAPPTLLLHPTHGGRLLGSHSGCSFAAFSCQRRPLLLGAPGGGATGRISVGAAVPRPQLRSVPAVPHAALGPCPQTKRFVRQAGGRRRWQLQQQLLFVQPRQCHCGGSLGSPSTWDSTLTVAHTRPGAVHLTPVEPPPGL